MNHTQLNEKMIGFIQFALDNNQAGISEAMVDNGIAAPRMQDVAPKLYTLFTTNREKFVRILRQAGWNANANNYTTSGTALTEMKQHADSYEQKYLGKSAGTFRQGTGPSDGARWYNDVLDTLVGGGQSEQQQTTTVTEPAAGAQTKTIVIAVGAFAAIGLILWFFMKK